MLLLLGLCTFALGTFCVLLCFDDTALCLLLRAFLPFVSTTVKAWYARSLSVLRGYCTHMAVRLRLPAGDVVLSAQEIELRVCATEWIRSVFATKLLRWRVVGLTVKASTRVCLTREDVSRKGMNLCVRVRVHAQKGFHHDLGRGH
jgi:hypothetical protein